MYGSDQSASIEMNGLAVLIKVIRKIEKALGEEKLGFVSKEEEVIAKKLRSHIK